jgi:polyisoprenoid-binding protein YceI
MPDTHVNRRVSARRAGGATGIVLVLAATAWFVAGCAARPPAQARAETSAAAAAGTPFRLDATASRIRLYLHAEGPLARMGHSHLISTSALSGTIWLPPEPGHATCDFQLQDDGFLVDDPQERAVAGGEFAEPLDEDARAGTREHMLGERQLDAQHYPSVLLHCQQVNVTGDSATVKLVITLRGKETSLQVPVKWQRNGNALQAEGELTFRQSDIGLQPYSLMFGALRVADEINATFKLLARQQ